MADDNGSIPSTDKRCNIAVAPLVCFGGEDWWYHNRGHYDMQIVRRFAKNVKTLYVNSIVMRKPVISEGRHLARCIVRKAKSIFKGVRDSGEGFKVYSPVSLPVHHLSWARGANRWFLSQQLGLITSRLGMRRPIVWVACPAACDAAIKMTSAALVYQRTDRFEDYPNVDVNVIRSYDQRLKQAADMTVYVNRTLYEDEGSECRNAVLSDHGVDYELFSNAHEDPALPEDLRDIPHPIAGFFGGIDDHTSNIKLMEQVVTELPGFSFVFVGKASSDCDRLAANRNVFMLGQKPYEMIPHYGKAFDVCFMPWQQNRWIQACNPVKLKEYLALGKPIVTTPFRELEFYEGLTYQAVGADDFARAIQQALDEDNPERARARRDHVKDKSWDAVARKLMDALIKIKTQE